MDRTKKNAPPGINTSPQLRRINNTREDDSTSSSPSPVRKKTSSRSMGSNLSGGGHSPQQRKQGLTRQQSSSGLLNSRETVIASPLSADSDHCVDGGFQNHKHTFNGSNDQLVSNSLTLRGDDPPGTKTGGADIEPVMGTNSSNGSSERLVSTKSQSRSRSRKRSASYTPSSIGREHSSMVASGEIPNTLDGFAKEEEGWGGRSDDPNGHDPTRTRIEKIVPLRKTEVWAWYFQNATYCVYGWVSAVMMVPLLIQDVAAMNGVETANHSIPCDTSQPNYDCVMHIYGSHYLDPGTISLYISSLSAVVSFLVSLSIAAVADHGAYRKHLLLVFAAIGCLASLAFFIIQSPSMFWLTVILSPLGWACYNVSSVFSNAFLPIYVRVHPKVLEAAERAALQRTLHKMDVDNKLALKEASMTQPMFEPEPFITKSTSRSGSVRQATTGSAGDQSPRPQQGSSTSPPQNYQHGNISNSGGSSPVLANQLDLLDITPAESFISFSTAEQRKVEEQVTNDLSAWCTGAANVGSAIVMGVCIGISVGMDNSLLSLQIAIAYTGVWWLIWTIAVMPWLEARPGPPLPKGTNWLVYSWSKNYKTLKAMRQLTQVTKFIFAWFMLSDGVNTVTALLYVITYQDLKFTHTKSLVMTITISAMAFFGAYIFLWIRQRWCLSTKFMVMLTLGLYSALTAYFVITPYITSNFGLRHEWEAWVSVAYLGLIISTFYGVARVMMAELCPEGDENEWFSIFQLADKGSSWIGPFVTGAIQSLTGEYRPGFFFPLALFLVGGLLLLSVDMDKGKDEASQYKADQQAKARLLASVPPITITVARDSVSRD
ncbi:MFS transporter, UMF1 family [Entomortierella parvispora]|uniref:Autophagy-related protein n=1 Tax=Entomortierella parvispora TaxID=205924 RepID=A0A9P3M266_9FUNG|nr:MFS transporter, UMF1 family [Entomortierella parvispora]